MAVKSMGGFDILIDLSRKFVENKTGVWDHTAWLDFLTDAQKRGIELTDEMKTHLGSVLESMKKVYEATSSTKGMEKVMADVSRLTVNFVKEKKGVWGHSGWESFLKDFQKKGFDLTVETSSHIGAVLDASRQLYMLSPVLSKKEAKEVKKPAPAKKK